MDYTSDLKRFSQATFGWHKWLANTSKWSCTVKYFIGHLDMVYCFARSIISRSTVSIDLGHYRLEFRYKLCTFFPSRLLLLLLLLPLMSWSNLPTKWSYVLDKTKTNHYVYSHSAKPDQTKHFFFHSHFLRQKLVQT